MSKLRRWEELMRKSAIVTAAVLLTGIAVPCFPSALAAGGTWTFVIDRQDQPDLIYSENGNDAFTLGCGLEPALYANYPGAADHTGDASITISNGTDSMVLKGTIVTPPTNDILDKDGLTVTTPKTGDNIPAQFAQWNYGFSRQDTSEETEKASDAIEARLLNMLDSKKPLTISAEGKSYALPPVNAPNWKAHFKKIC
jgi:hypothetical protein